MSGKIEARTVAGYLESEMEELHLDLTIRKTAGGWEAMAVSGHEWSVGVRGNTPQRAMLRLALALIALPKDMPRLQMAFSVDDPISRRAIGDAENAARAVHRQMSGGICSVEQCQGTEAPTSG